MAGPPGRCDPALNAFGCAVGGSLTQRYRPRRVALPGSLPGSIHRQRTNLWTVRCPPSQTSIAFGIEVALSGDLALVAAGGSSHTGEIYVFTRNQGAAEFSLTNTMVPSGVSSNGYGTALTLNGDFAVVGASNEVSGTARIGAVYVYQRGTANTLTELQRITPQDGAVGDSFGYSVALSNEFLLVGAPFVRDSRGNRLGAVYAMKFNSTIGRFELVQKLNGPEASGTQEFFFGLSVALQGDRAYIAAPFEAGRRGAVYVFKRTSPDEQLVFDQKILGPPNGGDLFGEFGTDLAVSGARLVVGAPFALTPEIDNTHRGVAWVFAQTATGGFSLHQRLAPSAPHGPGGYFGASVALAGAFAIIGDPELTVPGNGRGEASTYVLQSPQAVPAVGDWACLLLFALGTTLVLMLPRTARHA